MREKPNTGLTSPSLLCSSLVSFTCWRPPPFSLFLFLLFLLSLLGLSIMIKHRLHSVASQVYRHAVLLVSTWWGEVGDGAEAEPGTDDKGPFVSEAQVPTEILYITEEIIQIHRCVIDGCGHCRDHTPDDRSNVIHCFLRCCHWELWEQRCQIPKPRCYRYHCGIATNRVL